MVGPRNILLALAIVSAIACSADSKVIDRAARQEGEEQAAAATAAQAENDEGGSEAEAQIMVCSADSKVINQAARQEGEEQAAAATLRQLHMQRTTSKLLQRQLHKQRTTKEAARLKRKSWFAAPL